MASQCLVLSQADTDGAMARPSNVGNLIDVQAPHITPALPFVDVTEAQVVDLLALQRPGSPSEICKIPLADACSAGWCDAAVDAVAMLDHLRGWCSWCATAARASCWALKWAPRPWFLSRAPSRQAATWQIQELPAAAASLLRSRACITHALSVLQPQLAYSDHCWYAA